VTTTVPRLSGAGAPDDGAGDDGAGDDGAGDDGAADAEVTDAEAAADGRGARDRWFLWLLVAALVVGGGLRVAAGLTDDAPTSDETAYLASGTSLADGHGFERDGHPELHFPPLVPAVLGLASEVFADPHTGAVWVAIVAGTAAIAPMALLARRIAGDVAGAATAWIAALAPGLATLPATRGTGSETEYVLMAITALWLAVSASGRVGADRLVRLAGAGALAGLAYLTRPEGLLVALAIGMAVLVPGLRRRRQPGAVRAMVTTAAAYALPLLVCIVPYAAYLHANTGSWSVTAKSQDVSLEAWHAVARGDRHSRDQVLYALDESGYRFADDRSSLTSLAREDPGGFLAIVGTNLRELAVNLAGVSLLPLPVWALAAYGAWRHWRRSGAVALLVAAAALSMLTTLAFFVQPRYLVLLPAIGAVLAGVGLVHLPRRWRGPAVGMAVLLLAATSVQAFRGDDAGWWHPDEHTDQRHAGEWIAEHTDADERIMTRSMVVAYYGERYTVPIPYADVDTVLDFARHYGVRYLVVDSAHVGSLRPQLVPLLTDDDQEGLRLVHELRSEGRTSRVFALDPAPPPSDLNAPRLGFMGDA
jgi:4-amino-4-deoxy-L-arabinose transferase-like glycosyltransferase